MASNTCACRAQPRPRRHQSRHPSPGAVRLQTCRIPTTQSLRNLYIDIHVCMDMHMSSHIYLPPRERSLREGERAQIAYKHTRTHTHTPVALGCCDRGACERVSETRSRTGICLPLGPCVSSSSACRFRSSAWEKSAKSLDKRAARDSCSMRGNCPPPLHTYTHTLSLTHTHTQTHTHTWIHAQPVTHTASAVVAERSRPVPCPVCAAG